MRNDKLVGKVVQSAPKVVNAITCHQSPAVINWRRMVCSVEVLSTSVTHLGVKHVGAAVNQRIERCLQLVKVEVTSLYFDFDAVKRGVLTMSTPPCGHSGGV